MMLTEFIIFNDPEGVAHVGVQVVNEDGGINMCDKVAIRLPNGESVEGCVQNWRDFDKSNMTPVEINGKTYLTCPINMTMAQVF